MGWPTKAGVPSSRVPVVGDQKAGARCCKQGGEADCNLWQGLQRHQSTNTHVLKLEIHLSVNADLCSLPLQNSALAKAALRGSYVGFG